MQIIKYEDKYRDDMIFMVLEAKNSLGRVPRLNKDLLDVYSAYISCGDMFWLALDDNDRVIGCLGFNMLNSTQAKLHRFYVKADKKHQGIGSALLETCEQYLIARSCKEVVAHVGDLFMQSKGFYEKKGYIEYQSCWMKKILF